MNNFENIEELKKKFNWGAFLLGWIWGILNKSYITLIQIPVSFIPYVGGWLGIGLAIFFGIKGNAWALANKQFESSLKFIKFQKILACIGVIAQATVIIVAEILLECSSLRPVDYDISITTKLIKMLLLILLLIYIVVGVFIVKIIKQK